MSKNKIISNAIFWLAVLIVIVAALLIAGTWLRWFRLSGELFGELIHHWFSYIGAGFIAIYLPIYSILKRRYPYRLKTLLSIHVFGNLLSVAAICIHFTHQLTRPPQAFPNLGTGVVLIAGLIILVITGFGLRFHFAGRRWASWRWLHTGMMLSFYLLIIMHVLHGLGVI